MTKGLRILAWMQPGSKLMECNLQKAVVDGYIFNYWWTNFHYFFNRVNFEQAALNIQIWVALLYNIMIHKCYILGLVALSPGIQHQNILQKNPERLQDRLSHITC